MNLLANPIELPLLPQVMEKCSQSFRIWVQWSSFSACTELKHLKGSFVLAAFKIKDNKKKSLCVTWVLVSSPRRDLKGRVGWANLEPHWVIFIPYERRSGVRGVLGSQELCEFLRPSPFVPLHLIQVQFFTVSPCASPHVSQVQFSALSPLWFSPCDPSGSLHMTQVEPTSTLLLPAWVHSLQVSFFPFFVYNRLQSRGYDPTFPCKLARVFSLLLSPCVLLWVWGIFLLQACAQSYVANFRGL